LRRILIYRLSTNCRRDRQRRGRREERPAREFVPAIGES